MSDEIIAKGGTGSTVREPSASACKLAVIFGLAACLLSSGAVGEGLRFSVDWPPAPPPGMVYVPAGTFVMGAHSGLPDSTPKQRVLQTAFYIDRCEVTNAEYAAFIATTGHRAPSSCDPNIPTADWDGNGIIPGHEQMPVCEVDWADADAYAKWAGKRLPTEAEWEKAARGIDGRVFPWGNDWDPTRCNFITDGPTEVGAFPQGASVFGCLDMAGNVWEWTASYYERYPGNTEKGNDWYGHKCRVVRGGSWADHCMYGVRCYARSYGDPENRLPSTGFRCALSVPDLKAFEGIELPAGVDQTTGRALIEALARAVPKWSAPAEKVHIRACTAGRYEVSVPGATGHSGARLYVLLPTAGRVWVAAVESEPRSR